MAVMSPDALLASGGDSVATSLVEFGALLLGLGILARLSAVVGVSPIPLFLIAGLAFGEGGWFVLGVDEDLVAVTAEIGAVLLLLLLGLEYSGRELVATMKHQWRSGIYDIVLNSLPGVAFGLLLGWGLLGAVALGGVTYISSSGIVAQLVRDLKWRRKAEVPGVVGLLIVEDIVMAPYLPIVTAIATGAGLVTGLVSVGVALSVVGLVLLLSVKRVKVINSLLDANQPVALLLTLFGATILVAGFATLFDFSSAVAAFLVGLLFTGEVAEAARTRLAPLRDLFAAIFFVFFGLSTNPADIPAVFPIALALAVVGIVTKMVTGRIIAARAEASERAKWRAGAVLIARGEFSVVIAGIVAVSPLAPPQLAPLVTTYVLITAVVGPVLARLAEPWSNWRESRKGDGPVAVAGN
ncbi:MAG: CPA2 family monovalent cation:H+ antiporter-2 [Actinomycetes bacterium]|jgi:CPA2 family monovalent cation:H+ antiporter-2